MDNICNLYITFGTLPALYAQMNIYLDSTPSYVWVRNGGYYNYKKNPPNNLKFYQKFDGCDDADFLNIQYRDITDKMNEIIQDNSKVKFNIICDDSRIQFILKIIVPMHLQFRISKTIIISEGNMTESMYRNVNENYFITTKLKWEKLLNKESYSEDEWNKQLQNIDNYAFWLATQDNVEYLIPNLETLTNYKNYKMNLISLNLLEMYNKLNNTAQKDLVNNTIPQNIEREFSNINNKIIIITGTYDFVNNEITTFIYSNLINKVIDDYGKEYSLFYKAHPLFPVEKNEQFTTFLELNNISILPEKLPLEILLWGYPHVKIGGFCSSMYSLILTEQIKFFFGELNGFSKYIFKRDDPKYKFYNLELSQDMALLSLQCYNKYNGYNSSIDNKLKNINDSLQEIKNIRNDLENLKIAYSQNNLIILNHISSLNRRLKLVTLPLLPFLWLKRKFTNHKKSS